ncbi:MAG: hypothetical protein H7Z74_11255 [Anaerolineae bacterium]|nr:hypothetical protein [Gemmatimonadaceae bacterium]
MRAYFHEIRRGADEPLMADYSPFIARAKGPMVYDMLRRRVGSDVFFDVWRDLAARGGSASLADLRRLYVQSAASDTGLPTFLSQWMDRKGAPIVDVAWTPAGRVTLTQHSTPYVLDVPLRLHGRLGARDTTVHLSRQRQTFMLGPAKRVELDPDDHLLLWKPRFGPPPDAPASWSVTRWRQWMDVEVPWLMQSYEVRSAAISVIKSGRVVWTKQYGGDAPSTSALVRALADSLADRADTAAVRGLAASGGDVSLTIGRPAEQVGVVVIARGGWGGRQLTMHIAQRVAIQYGWSVIPR